MPVHPNCHFLFPLGLVLAWSTAESCLVWIVWFQTFLAVTQPAVGTGAFLMHSTPGAIALAAKWAQDVGKDPSLNDQHLFNDLLTGEVPTLL